VSEKTSQFWQAPALRCTELFREIGNVLKKNSLLLTAGEWPVVWSPGDESLRDVVLNYSVLDLGLVLQVNSLALGCSWCVWPFNPKR